MSLLPAAHSQKLRGKVRGFTLTELAMVLVIIALLLGGLLVPLSTQREIEKRKETAAQLNTIREALISYVLINGRLPCPDYGNDPTVAGYGEEDLSCQNWTVGVDEPTTEGFLPWKTLGTSEYDAWGTAWRNATEPRQGHWRYRIERDYADTNQGKILLTKSNTDPCGDGPFPKDCLAIVNSDGQVLYAQKERPIALIYSVGANGIADGNNSNYEANKAGGAVYQSDTPSTSFDDQLIWLTRNTLVAPLVAVGKLP